MFKNKVFQFSKTKKYSGIELEEDKLGSNDGGNELTEDEVHELLKANPVAQSEIDKRVRNAVEKNATKMQKEFLKTLEAKKQEWEEEAELAKQGVELSDDDVVKQLQKEIFELRRDSLMKEAKTQLVKQGVPEFFTAFVTGKDMEETNKNIEELTEVLTEYAGEVKKKNLRGFTPVTQKQTSVSKEEGRKVSDITSESELLKRYGHLRK